MASQTQPSDIDPFKLLNITLNSDGSLTRHPHAALSSSPAAAPQLTLFKDIPLNPTTATFLRIYRPVSPTAVKLPIIIYFHPGGFILMSATTPSIDLTCSDICAYSPAIVISLEYRLAPEHRLPAAYDDGVDAIRWVRDQALGTELDGCDKWLSEMADFSKVYLMGTSAGGNLTYYAGLRALDHDLDPITIQGLIIDQPFFSGVEHTETELRLTNDRIFPLVAADLMWSLSLPLGSNKDHEYCNPLGDQNRSFNQKIKRLANCLVRVNGGDPMVDKQNEFANMLEAHGVHVTRKFYEEWHHAIELFDPNRAQILYDDVKNFILN